MFNRAALANSSGLAILAASAALAFACALVPQLAAWSDMPPWLLLAGLVAYAGTVAVHSLRGASQEAVLESAELRAVRGIRNRLAALDLEEDLVGGTPTFARSLADTVTQLDERLIPALELLVQRHAVLEERLANFEKQAELRPGEEVLSRLYAIEGRQRRAIADCVQQAADAEAALLAIAQEGGDEEHAAAEAEAWTTRLLTLHEFLVDVMRGESGLARQETGAERPSGWQEHPASKGRVRLLRIGPTTGATAQRPEDDAARHGRKHLA